MTYTTSLKAFLAQKNVSPNTLSAYRYDLQQFLLFLDGQAITQERVTYYQLLLSKQAVSAQKRKRSTINQFLKYLYQTGEVSDFLELHLSFTGVKEAKSWRQPGRLQEFPDFYQPLTTPGQLIALLILEFGLTPSEIQQLRWQDFNWSFKVLTVNTRGIQRNLPIRSAFAKIVQNLTNADELFTKSRQFLYLELKKYTPLTAKELREQHILRQVKRGLSIYDLAQQLGLKTITTLEKYYHVD